MLLAGRGHDLVVGYRSDHAAAQEVVKAARAAGARVVAVAGDIVDDDHVTALFAAAAKIGPVSGLVNNAGLTAHVGDLADTPVAVVRQVVEVNLIGALLCARRRPGDVYGPGRRGAGRSSTSPLPRPPSGHPTSTCTTRRPRPASKP